MVGGCSAHEGDGGFVAVDFHKDVAVGVVDVLDAMEFPARVVAGVIALGVEGGAGGSGDDLVHDGAWVGGVSGDGHVVVEVVVAAEEDPGAGFDEALPEGVSLGGVGVQGVFVGAIHEGGLVALGEDEGVMVAGEDLVYPSLVDGFLADGVLIEAEDEYVVEGVTVG